MKIRYLAILYTLLVLIITGICFTGIRTNQQRPVDVVAQNVRLRQAEQKLAGRYKLSQEERTGIREEYDCRIVLCTDAEYESLVMQAISRGDILYDYSADGLLQGKIIFDGEGAGYDRLRNRLNQIIMVAAALFLLGGYGLLAFLYIWYIRPFRKMEHFAGEVAKGNLDMPLTISRSNYFGVFTESFDLMREELKQARESEYRANISKKELVAGLSHDIKTPVATIKATCEVMQVKESDPDTRKKIEIIENKAELIDRLIGNMFHATLEELEVLTVKAAEIPSAAVVDMIMEMQDYGKISLMNDIPSCLIWADIVRLQQVIDNVVNNAYKYAGTGIAVSFADEESGIRITMKDDGPGVPEEELPLLTGKFYRGSNAEGKDGSGLGLFLSRNFMERMGGALEYHNDNGFVVSLFLVKV